MRGIATMRMKVVCICMGVMIAMGLLLLQPAWAIGDELNAAAVKTQRVGAISTMQFVYQDPAAQYQNYISSSGITSGSVAFNPTTNTLTLNNVKGDGYSAVDVQLEKKNVTVVLVGTNSLENLGLRVSAATITGQGSLDGTIRLYAGSATIQSGSVNGLVSANSGSVSVSGGCVDGAIDCYNGTLTVSGGTVKQSNDKSRYVVNAGSLVVKGGTVESTNSEYGIYIFGSEGKRGSFSMSGGKVSVSGTTGSGISVRGNLKMTGGTLKVVGNHSSNAIAVHSYEYRSKTYGGKVQITGGKLYVTVTKPADRMAVSASSMSCKISCLKSVAGMLPVGAHFISAKNEYAVTKYGSVKLVKYKNQNRKPTLRTVTYGKSKYKVTGIGANAFNTKAGRKVAAITVGTYVTSIAKNAFYKTTSLKKLTFKNYWWTRKYTSNYSKLKSVQVTQGYSIAKKAFNKCGKKGGKGLTVVFGKGVYKQEIAQYRAALKSRGMAKAVKIKTL